MKRLRLRAVRRLLVRAAVFCGLAWTLSVAAEPNRPVMGFDNYYSGWNGTTDLSKFGRTNVYCGASERFVLIMATNYLADGLHALGYDWMCISDGWQGGRDSNGEIYADTNRFPHGMAHTISVLHQLGFKARLYTEVGDGVTCCGRIKSSGTNGLKDAITFAKWKVDGITVDTCNDFTSDEVKRAAHEQFIGYFRSNNIPILYDLHVSPTRGQFTNGPAEWMAQFDTWQFTTEWGTQRDVWHDAVTHIDMAALTTQWMRPGHTPNLLIMTLDWTAYKGHFGRLLFTFWSMFQSPLVVAEDFISYPAWDGAKYQTNGYCIAIDQDPFFAPPVKMFTNGANSEVWVKPLASGATALAFLNRTNTTESVTIDMAAVGVEPGTVYRLTDAWNYTNFQSSEVLQSFPSPPNSVQLWLLSPPRPPSPALTFSNTDVTIRWPASAPGCYLQRAKSLSGGQWETITNTPAQWRDLKHISFPVSGSAEFYRLVQ